MPIINFDKVELLLPMTGANNGTVFTDYSLRQRTVTRVGAVTSTAQSKFAAYGSSGLFNGTSDNLTLPSEFGHIFAGSDFCVEAWIRFSTLGSTRVICGQRESGSLNHAFSFFVTAAGSLRFTTGGAAGDVDSTVSVVSSDGEITTGSWIHIAVTRSAGTIRSFVGGAQVASGAISHNIHQSSFPFRIGALNDPAALFFEGNMQDFAITIGAAKYTAVFTPPARMTQRELTRANTGTDSHEFDRAVLFDFNGGAHVGRHTTVVPNSSGNFTATNLIDLEYGVAFVKGGCGPECRGPVEVDADP